METREEREDRLKKENKNLFPQLAGPTLNIKVLNILRFFYSAVLLLERYCSMSQKILRFKTPDEAMLLVFGVPNAKSFGIWHA